jgi:hypothetical protein
MVIHQLNLRPALTASVRLGVEAAIKWIVILRLASGAHLEVTHGCLGAVIGHVLDYGEARSAIGAVGKRVTIAAVTRIQQLTKASLTRGDIGGDELVFAFFSKAVTDLKTCMADRRMISDSYVFDMSQRRSLCLEL